MSIVNNSNTNSYTVRACILKAQASLRLLLTQRSSGREKQFRALRWKPICHNPTLESIMRSAKKLLTSSMIFLTKYNRKTRVQDFHEHTSTTSVTSTLRTTLRIPQPTRTRTSRPRSAGSLALNKGLIRVVFETTATQAARTSLRNGTRRTMIKSCMLWWTKNRAAGTTSSVSSTHRAATTS